MSNDTIDGNGAIHSGSDGRFTGHVQGEGDAAVILRDEPALARAFIDQFGSPYDALRVLAAEAGMAIHYQDRSTFEGELDRKLTDAEWERIKPYLEDYDEWLDNSGASDSMGYWRGHVLERAGVPEWPDDDDQVAGPAGPLYEKCAHCHLFIEANDDAVDDPTLAAYLHLSRGDEADEAIESTHDAAPSGDRRTIADWKQSGPAAMRARFTD